VVRPPSLLYLPVLFPTPFVSFSLPFLFLSSFSLSYSAPLLALHSFPTRRSSDLAMPSEDILRLYKDCGGEIITLGSDAHHADHVGRHFETFSALLSEIGFQYICSFDDRKPIFHPIQQFL